MSTASASKKTASASKNQDSKNQDSKNQDAEKSKNRAGKADTEANGTPFTLDLKLPVQRWAFPGTPVREYCSTTIPYGQYNKIAISRRYDAAKSEGIQRDIVVGHAKNIGEAIRTGHFTPTSLSISLTERIAKAMRRDGDYVDISISETDPADISNGQHRGYALSELIADAEDQVETLKKVKGLEDLTTEAFVEAINALPITLMVYLEPARSTEDFLNTQKGLGVNKTQLLNQSLDAGLVKEEYRDGLLFARDLAKRVFKKKDSHLYQQILFDARSTSGMGFQALASTTKSEGSFSLYGGAKICLRFGKNPNWLADVYTQTYQAFYTYDIPENEDENDLLAGTPSLLRGGGVCLLAPNNLNGTKGGTKLINGIANIVAARVLIAGRKTVEESDLELAIRSAQQVFNKPQLGNLTAPSMRQMMGRFTTMMFADFGEKGIEITYEDGVPSVLVEMLGESTFNIGRNMSDGSGV